MLGMNGLAKAVKAKPKTAGRFASINWFCEVAMCDLTSSERAVWLTLWRYEKDGVAEVSHNHLAELGGMSRLRRHHGRREPDQEETDPPD